MEGKKREREEEKEGIEKVKTEREKGRKGRKGKKKTKPLVYLIFISLSRWKCAPWSVRIINNGLSTCLSLSPLMINLLRDVRFSFLQM